MWRRPLNCERARLALSLDLDGELHELERAFLRAHVARCEPCRAFRDQVASTTSLIRAEPLEPIANITLPAARAAWRYSSVARFATSGAALMLVALLGATQLARSPGVHPHFGVEARGAGSAKELRQTYAEFRLVGHERAASLPSNGRVV